MPTVKRIVCLANSRKLSDRCIAGKEYSGGQPGGWVRPVSAREHEEVSECERQYQDRGDPCVLDIMDVPFLEARPKNYQQENWLLDPEHYWVREPGWVSCTPSAPKGVASEFACGRVLVADTVLEKGRRRHVSRRQQSGRSSLLRGCS